MWKLFWDRAPAAIIVVMFVGAFVLTLIAMGCKTGGNYCPKYPIEDNQLENKEGSSSSSKDGSACAAK